MTRAFAGSSILARTPGERAVDLVEVEDLGDAVRLRVAAQAPLSWTGRYAAERGWSGMDWGVGLPGTIGGATVNNAGAHGTEQNDHLEAVIILNERGEIEERPAAWLEAAYRHTIIKAAPRPRPWTVLAAVMLLPKGDPAALVRLADEHAAFRKETQPTGACAGSTFANPPGDFAGRLLEESGLKGFAIGGAGVLAQARQLDRQRRHGDRGRRAGVDRHGAGAGAGSVRSRVAARGRVPATCSNAQASDE